MGSESGQGMQEQEEEALKIPLFRSIVPGTAAPQAY